MMPAIYPDTPPPRFPVLDATEGRALIFDFSADLAPGETLISPPSAPLSVYVTLAMGDSDPAPQDIITTPATIAPGGTAVVLGVGATLGGGGFGCTTDTDYRIKVTAATSNPLKTVTLVGILPVRFL